MGRMKYIQNYIQPKSIFVLSLLLAFVLYGNTLSHQYALDDAIVITQNEYTQKGIEGIPGLLTSDSFTGFFGKQKKLVAGGRYRPLSMVTFALEYEFFGKSPGLSHFINILLYGIITFLIFMVVRHWVSQRYNTPKATIMAGLTALVFILHPVHTEAVANIKGRDELLSLLFSLLAMWFFIKNAPGKKTVVNRIISLVLLFLGLLSKENAIAFVAIIPASTYFFKHGVLKKSLIEVLWLIIPSLIFVYIRNQVLGGFSFQPGNELMNNPFLEAGINQKYATIIYTWWVYLRLLIFPHPLTFDYYPYHIQLVSFSNPAVIFMVIVLGLLLYAFIKDAGKNGKYAFCILSFAASFILVSNLVFPVGTFMNERFLFMPSMFWALAIVFLLFDAFNKKAQVKYMAYAFLIYMLSFYPVKTIARNSAWENDFILFTTDVKTSVNSAKSNCSAGGKLWEKAKVTANEELQSQYYKQSEKYLRKALQVHPTYVDAWLLLGNVLFDGRKDIKGSVAAFFKVLSIQPKNPNALKNIDIVLQNSSNRKFQLKSYEKILDIYPNHYQTNYRLGVLYGRYFNQLNKSIAHLEKAVKINPQKIEALKDLGTAYGIAGESEKAYQVLKQGLKLAPDDVQLNTNLGIACMQLGKVQEGQQYFKKAEALKSD